MLHVFLPVLASHLFICIGFRAFYLYWLSGAATNWLPASPTTDASSGTLRFNMVRILDEGVKEDMRIRTTQMRILDRRIIKDNLARKPWISCSGLNPHSPSKSVRAMAISGLWLGSLYTCTNQTYYLETLLQILRRQLPQVALCGAAARVEGQGELGSTKPCQRLTPGFCL